MQRKSTAAMCLLAVVILLACSRNGPPDSLFENAGCHVTDCKVYYLNAFPGKAFEISGADARTFQALDSAYGRDKSNVYVNGVLLADAEAANFKLLARAGFAKDRRHVYQRDRAISDDPAHFELLEGNLAKDSQVVYRGDGWVLSDDPTHFAIISTADNYLFTRDGRTVHVNGNPIVNADPATFRLLQGVYARDDRHVFYFDAPIADADLPTFRPLEGPYAIDSAYAYWMGKTIDGADPRSFRVLNADFECSADDRRAYYRQAAIPPVPTRGAFRRSGRHQLL